VEEEGGRRVEEGGGRALYHLVVGELEDVKATKEAIEGIAHFVAEGIDELGG
jgi:hypothetical protein